MPHQPIKNIIIQVNINYNRLDEDYQKFIDGLETDQFRKELQLTETDRLKKNGTFSRGLYYTSNNCLRYSRIKIQKLLLTTVIDGEEKKIYLSVFPSFISKYNRVSLDLIEEVSNSIRKGEDIFTIIDDPECLLPAEDILARACQRIDNTCKTKNLAAIVNASYTEIYNTPILLPDLKDELQSLRYPMIYLLCRTGQALISDSKPVLPTLNKILKFLR